MMKLHSIPLVVVLAACGAEAPDAISGDPTAQNSASVTGDARGSTSTVWTVAATSEAIRVDFLVQDKSGQVVKDFADLNTQKMHLFGFDVNNLALLAHSHPTADAQGQFHALLPIAPGGKLGLFAEYQVTGATSGQIDRGEFSSGSEDGAAHFDLVNRKKSANGLTFTLKKDQLMVGMAMPLLVVVTDASGQPAALDPWLAKGGHLLAVQAAAPRLYHFYATPGSIPKPGELSFNCSVDKSGNFRVFVQVLKHGELEPTTVFFDVLSR